MVEKNKEEIIASEHINLKNLRAYYERIQRKVISKFCKNSIVGIKQTKNDTVNHIYDFKITEAGCLNKRRHGSKWCQECSDKHNNN